jgi:predicted nucleic acid-binding protein
MKYVIDASWVASLFLPDEASEKSASFADQLAVGDAAAPSLLQLEVTNILLMARRRRRISGVQLQQLSDAFDQFPVTYQPPLTSAQRATVIQLAEKHGLSAYDAAYLELTMRTRTQLLSLDDQLVKAAGAEGVETE